MIGRRKFNTLLGDAAAWETKGNTLCAEWKERPNNACVRYDKTGETVTVIDAASGQLRAKIVKTVSGNAENLAP